MANNAQYTLRLPTEILFMIIELADLSYKAKLAEALGQDVQKIINRRKHVKKTRDELEKQIWAERFDDEDCQLYD
ncbi:hypothetical protein HKX48_002889, partial [Thoreauomyces humboldtii]